MDSLQRKIRCSHTRTGQAFTLVELLVVISIIGLLIALLLPALAAAKNDANTVVCASNLRQLAMAFTIYGQENRGATIPPSSPYEGYTNATSKSTFISQFWMMPMLPDTDRTRALRFCPSAPAANAVDTSVGSVFQPWSGSANPSGSLGDNAGMTDHSTYPPTAIAGSYGINGWLYDIANLTDYYVQLNIDYTGLPAATAESYYITRPSSVSQPTRTPVFGDSTWHEGWPMESDWFPKQAGYTSAKPTDPITTGGGYMMSRFYIGRHGKAINISYLDGHVSLTPVSNLWNLHWHRNYNVPYARLTQNKNNWP